MDNGEEIGHVLDDLKIERYCCRTLFMTHQDNLRKIAKFRV
ncbi:MAG: hypothetical protein V1802_03150 [Candidatus Aenigmatarchaeota archaeon]